MDLVVDIENEAHLEVLSVEDLESLILFPRLMMKKETTAMTEIKTTPESIPVTMPIVEMLLSFKIYCCFVPRSMIWTFTDA